MTMVDSGDSMAMKAVFIGGAPRSGTTFLGSLLGGHPTCIATPESSFKVDALISQTSLADMTIDSIAIHKLLRSHRFRTWELRLNADVHGALERANTVAEVMFLLARAYAGAMARETASVWVDHTPSNIRYVDRLGQHFPEAKFIHLVRDGRAVGASILPLNWGPNTIAAAAEDWMGHVAAGLAAEARLLEDKIVRVRYEDLVRAPEAELRRLCEFLKLDFHESMTSGIGFQPESYSLPLHPHVGQPPRTDRITTWQSKLGSRDIEIFEARTNDLLVLLGYPLVFGWRARGPTFFEISRMHLEEGYLRVRRKAALRRRIGRYAAKAGPL